MQTIKTYKNFYTNLVQYYMCNNFTVVTCTKHNKIKEMVRFLGKLSLHFKTCVYNMHIKIPKTKFDRHKYNVKESKKKLARKRPCIPLFYRQCGDSMTQACQSMTQHHAMVRVQIPGQQHQNLQQQMQCSAIHNNWITTDNANDERNLSCQYCYIGLMLKGTLFNEPTLRSS